MKKILNILFVDRPETKNKWWHRLFTVFLIGSGIIIFIFTFFLFLGNYNYAWVTHSPVAFSLEPNYQKISGKEFVCNEDLSAFPISGNEPMIDAEGMKCDGVILSDSESKSYAKLYDSAEQNLAKQYGLDKYTPTCGSYAYGTPLSPDVVSCIQKELINEKADPAYASYENAYKNLARVKVSTSFHPITILSDIFLWIIIPVVSTLIWVLFWSSIIYRSILYVIFGKKK